MTAERTYLLVDLGGTRVRTAVSGGSGELRGRREARTVTTGPDGVVAQIAAEAGRSASDAGVGWDRISLAAVSAPGPLDTGTGTVYNPPNLPGWGEVPLRSLLESALGMPVMLVNDANAGALGEYAFGAGRGARNLMYITVSTGIGGGIVLDGAVYEGSAGTAGEIGHSTVDRHGPVCGCGNIGCVEVIASGTAIARRFNEAVRAGAATTISPSEGDAYTAADVARGAVAGDQLSHAIFVDAAEAVGTAVVNSLHILNPDAVVIGGGVTHAGDLFFDAVRSVVDRYAMIVPRNTARILPAQLGDDVGLIGALAAALSLTVSG
jgi:glucokinase